MNLKTLCLAALPAAAFLFAAAQLPSASAPRIDVKMGLVFRESGTWGGKGAAVWLHALNYILFPLLREEGIYASFKSFPSNEHLLDGLESGKVTFSIMPTGDYIAARTAGKKINPFMTYRFLKDDKFNYCIYHTGRAEDLKTLRGSAVGLEKLRTEFSPRQGSASVLESGSAYLSFALLQEILDQQKSREKIWEFFGRLDASTPDQESLFYILFQGGVDAIVSSEKIERYLEGGESEKLREKVKSLKKICLDAQYPYSVMVTGKMLEKDRAVLEAALLDIHEKHAKPFKRFTRLMNVTRFDDASDFDRREEVRGLFALWNKNVKNGFFAEVSGRYHASKNSR